MAIDGSKVVTIGRLNHLWKGGIIPIFADIAADYSKTATYEKGAFCIYECYLYKCTTAITTAEEFTADHWTKVMITDLLSSSSATGAICFAYIVGETALASDWLSMTSGGTALDPDKNTIYIIRTDGNYKNDMYLYDGTKYVLVNVSFTGATTTTDGSRGLVPQPKKGDQNYVLCGDGTWRKVETGSLVQVTTTESAFYGKDVTLTDGTTTLTATLDSTGKAEFTNVSLAGSLTASCTDGTYTAMASVNVTYYGTYTATLSSKYATVKITTTDKLLEGASATIYNGSEQVGEVTLSTTTAATYISTELAELTIKTSAHGFESTNTVTVNAFATTFTTEMALKYYTLSISTELEELFGDLVTVTTTAGTVLANATLSDTGTATVYAGKLTVLNVKASDSEGNMAIGIVSAAAYGKTYAVELTKNFVTLTLTTSEESLYGKEIIVKESDVKVAEGIFSSEGKCTIYSNASGSLVITCTDGTNTAKYTVGAAEGKSYTVNLSLYHLTIKTSKSALNGNTVTLTDSTGTYTRSATFSTNAAVIDFDYEFIGKCTVSASDGTNTYNHSLAVKDETYFYTIAKLESTVYAFKVDHSNSDPDKCVTPYSSSYGCDNVDFTSAYMDFSTGSFNYGSWENAFFMPKPCMLKYDGTVDYYLDSNDFAKKEDGTDSDVANTSYEGNAMMEFPTIYFKRWMEDTMEYVVISDCQLDEDFHAYAHHDKSGKVLSNIYLSIYEPSLSNSKYRSLSGQALAVGYARQGEYDLMAANNTSSEEGEGWYSLHKTDWDMVNDLLTLIGMSLDMQSTFGYGLGGKGDRAHTAAGVMNSKGLFYGANNFNEGIKVFGIEGWWANIHICLAGYMNVSGIQKVKCTYGTEDGSTTTGFNLTGDGYIDKGAFPSGGYIKTWEKDATGMTVTGVGGSSSTYLCDTLTGGSALAVVTFGGSYYSKLEYGPFYLYNTLSVTHGDFNVGSRMSYKGSAS